MKFAYNIFHLDKDVSRQKNVLAVRHYLQSHAQNLNVETIEIASKKDVYEFCNAHKDFNLDLSGYNPKFLTRNIAIQYAQTRKGWKFGEIGIWASNYLAWLAFLESDADYLILMEDDCIIYNDFMPKVIEYMQELPEDWDVYHHFVHQQDESWYHPSLDVGEHVCKAYQEWSNLCYIINRKSVVKILNGIKNGTNLPLDWFWFKQLDIYNVYTVKPKVYSGIDLEWMESTFQFRHKRLDMTHVD